MGGLLTNTAKADLYTSDIYTSDEEAEESKYNYIATNNVNFQAQPFLSQQKDEPLSKKPLDILIHMNQTALNLLLSIKYYKGDKLSIITQIGRNESEWQPKRILHGMDRNEHMLQIFEGETGMKNIILLIHSMIRTCNLNISHITRRNIFPNDVISLIILFAIMNHPKVQSFRSLIPTSIICMNIPITCQYIGYQLSSVILPVFSAGVENVDEIKPESIINLKNTTFCRHLIILFDIILGLDQEKIYKQQYLTNNFTSYKRMHSDFLDLQLHGKNAGGKKNHLGGGFAAFQASKENEVIDEVVDDKEEDIAQYFTEEEILPIATLSNISMFMGKGSTACLDTIVDEMVDNKPLIQNALLSEFANGCFLLLKFNAHNKNDRNMSIVRHALKIMRAMCTALLMLDRRKTLQNNYNSIFGNNEKRVKVYDCCRLFTQHFYQWFGDKESVAVMDGVENGEDILEHCKYCRLIICRNSTGFRAGPEYIKNKIFSLMAE